jgi:integrase
MTFRLQQHNPHSGWRWPVNGDQYDRRPTLDATEQVALQALLQRLAVNDVTQPAIADPRLQRIVQPLVDLLHIKWHYKDYRTVINCFLLEVYHRSTLYWVWTSEEWSDFLGGRPSDASNAQRWESYTNYRQPLLLVAYLLCGYDDFRCNGSVAVHMVALATKFFGQDVVTDAVYEVESVLKKWGIQNINHQERLSPIIAELLLVNRSPHLHDLTYETLVVVHQRPGPRTIQALLPTISRVLVSLGILDTPLPSYQAQQAAPWEETTIDIGSEWLHLFNKWRDTSTLAEGTRYRAYYFLLKFGRWIYSVHPEITNPDQWTRQLSAEWIAAILKMKVGDYSVGYTPKDRTGEPLAPRGMEGLATAVRRFFIDCHEWEWVPVRFNPQRSLVTPRSVKQLIGPDPRIIQDDIWAKLLWAGLNLTEDDLTKATFAPGHEGLHQRRLSIYPIEMIRALTIVWLFCGLRSNEIYRLRVGCIRVQSEPMRLAGADDVVAPDSVCLLHVPVTKTSTAFVKPVDPIVGEAIALWEQVRPNQDLVVDQKTGELVHLLFMHRGMPVGRDYINNSLIPKLCRKAGIPEQDARGNITSHRARSTIATQLFNAKEPMTLFELQAWLGHQNPISTQQYAKIMPTKLAKAYVDAGYFERNARTINVLIDQEAVLNGDAANGLPWKYYDLGHGYCTYDFFDQCEHRMACAQCDYYRPKNAFLLLLEEKKKHLLYMKQEIPLTDLELSVVEGDLEATEKLIAQLKEIPTPSGQTPQQITDRCTSMSNNDEDSS